MIKISIITVCYNSEKLIKRCIDSVLPLLKERNDLLEYIIVDGASKDNTLSIIKSNTSDCQNVRIISEPDKGIYDAMNKGIRAAEGEYVYFLNSDDALIPSDFAKLLDFVDKDNSFDCVYCDVERTDLSDNGTEVCKKIWKPYDDFRILNIGMIFSHQGTICKKDTVIRLGLFDLQFKIAADWDLILRIYKNGGKFKYLPLCVAKFSYGGASEKFCFREKHLVRKKNKCYRLYDYWFSIDVWCGIRDKLKK